MIEVVQALSTRYVVVELAVRPVVTIAKSYTDVYVESIAVGKSVAIVPRTRKRDMMASLVRGEGGMGK